MKMPTEKMDTAMFAPCGMNCLVCYKHCYHKKPCAGCLNSDMGKPEHCRKCKITLERPACGAWADAGTACGADTTLQVCAGQL